MCLIIFSYQPDSNTPLLVAANRDEFFARPTDQAHFWKDEAKEGQILAGKDLQAGGTWLGVSSSLRFAAVTNIRDPSQTHPRPMSRGKLTKGFLQGNESAEQYSHTLADSFDQYAGYNLLLSDGESFFYVNNQQNEVRAVEPGVHGLSNGLLDAPWPKIEKGKSILQELLGSKQEIRTDQLIAMMNDRERAEHQDLPNTGVPLELEILLSSAFIENSRRGYGTLCSTALIQKRDGSLRFAEQNYDSTGNRAKHHFYQFNSLLAETGSAV
jgi:uncharacterized protein with NRDE domain